MAVPARWDAEVERHVRGARRGAPRATPTSPGAPPLDGVTAVTVLAVVALALWWAYARRLRGDGVVSAPAAPGRIPPRELLAMPESRRREYVRAVGRRVIERNREAAAILEAYDRGEPLDV